MILFRADGNAKIGSGHIMRCLSIADAFKRKNKESCFLLADKAFLSLIESRGYAVHILDSDYRNLDSEIEQVKTAVCNYQSEMVIIDSYYVAKNYLKGLKELVRLVYVDDLATFAYPVDMLVNYNAYGPYIAYKELYAKENETLPQLVLGLQYVPLREMFRNVPMRKQNEIVKNVLISTGGSDPIHLALKLAQYITKNSCSQRFHILVGAMNADYGRLKYIAETSNNIIVHHNVNDMRKLISFCDIAISAAGSTMYEIAACGVPMIIYVLADNQIPGAEAFEKLGLAISCGDLRDKDDAARILMNSVDSLAINFALRKQIGEKMQYMVDGLGADRLATKLLEFSENNYEL